MFQLSCTRIRQRLRTVVPDRNLGQAKFAALTSMCTRPPARPFWPPAPGGPLAVDTQATPWHSVQQSGSPECTLQQPADAAAAPLLYNPQHDPSVSGPPNALRFPQQHRHSTPTCQRVGKVRADREVGWLDVAVHEASCVQLLQRPQRAARQGLGGGGVEAAAGSTPCFGNVVAKQLQSEGEISIL